MRLLEMLQPDADERFRSDPTVGDPVLVRVGLLLGAIVLVLDQATKELAQLTLFRGRMVDVWADGWGWQLIYNDGGAFGFPAPTVFFVAVTVVVATITVRNLPHVTSLMPALAYGLLLAGAFGNVLDRILRTGDPGSGRFFNGSVIDFVAWGSFPRFNVADVAITFGFFLLLISMYLEERAQQADAADPAVRAAGGGREDVPEPA